MSPSSWSWVCCTPASAPWLSSRTAARSACRLSSSIRVWASSVALRGDLVAGRANSLDHVPGLVAKGAHAIGDRVVLRLDPLQILVAADHLVEAVRIQDHRHRVGLVRLVDRHQPLTESIQGALQPRAQDHEPALGPVQLRLLSLQLGGDDRFAVAQRGDLPTELVQPIVVALDRGRQHPFARLRVIQLGALLVQLGLQVLGRGPHGQRQQDDERGSSREQAESRASFGAGSIIAGFHPSLGAYGVS